MPLYDTACVGCKHEVEIKKKMSEDYPPCTKCGGKLETIFKVTIPVHFRGGGWGGEDCKRRKGE
jgi:putative FmdB family regulatory protein